MMIAPRQYAMALVGPEGRILGYLGSRAEWSALGIEMARKFASVAEAWIEVGQSVSQFANIEADQSVSQFANPDPGLGRAPCLQVVGLVTPGGP